MLVNQTELQKRFWFTFAVAKVSVTSWQTSDVRGQTCHVCRFTIYLCYLQSYQIKVPKNKGHRVSSQWMQNINI